MIRVFSLKENFCFEFKRLALHETLSTKQVLFTITNAKIDTDILHISPLEDKEVLKLEDFWRFFLKQIYLKKNVGIQIFVIILLFHMIL